MSEKPTEAEGLPKRWSAGRKSEVVLRRERTRHLGSRDPCGLRPVDARSWQDFQQVQDRGSRLRAENLQ